jgi:hypothetical protein
MTAANKGAVNSQIQQGRGNSQQKLTNIQSIWDLVNSQVTVTTGSGRSAQTVKMPSPLNDSGQQALLLPVLLDSCTTSTATDVAPRININTAPQAVLTALSQAVPALTDTYVQSIISLRPTPDNIQTDPMWRTTTWLLTQANIPATTLKSLDKYITGRTQVYRFQSIGYFDKGGPISRIEAVVDTNMGRPRIVYTRDITELGRGFDLSVVTAKSQ